MHILNNLPVELVDVSAASSLESSDSGKTILQGQRFWAN